MKSKRRLLQRLVGVVALVVFAIVASWLVMGESPGSSRQPMRAGPGGGAKAGPVSAEREEELVGAGPFVILPERFDLSPPMRDIIAPPQRVEPRPEVELSLPSVRFARRDARVEDFAEILQDWSGGLESLTAPIFNQDVLPNVTGYYPPDVEGDVGPNHYVEYINVDWAIYDKSGNLASGWPKAGNSFWSGFGGACETENDGDPIVMYDHLADRWFVSQFAVPNPFYQCIAVSQTPDPTGAWYRYAYQWPSSKFNDYPHFGLWPDGYYLTVNQFNAAGTAWEGAGVAAYEREQMLLGQSAQMIYFDFDNVNSNWGGQLPADLEGDPPPAGTPGYILEWEESGVFGGSDALAIWEFAVDWDTPSNSTLGTATNQPNHILNTANVDTNICTATRERCIQQLTSCTSVRLEALADRLMWRVQYREMDGYAAMVANHTVDSNSPAGRAGLHWFEMRDSGGGWSLHQQGVYAPADGLNRWVGSIAMDPVGNIGLFYSVSSSSSYPSIRYVGRLATDPLGTLPQAEQTVVNGTGCQTGASARWGDYASLSMDTGTESCTFWGIHEYVKTTGVTSWQTRLASFKFDECQDFSLDATPASLDVCAPNDAVYTVNVGSLGGYSNAVTLSASGRPAGTSQSFSVNPVSPAGSSTYTVGNTGVAAAGSYEITISGTGAGSPGHQAVVMLNLAETVPGAASLTAPTDGTTGQSTAPTFTWSAVAGAASYTIEIATDPGFANIVDSASGLTSSSYTPGSALSADTVYYWRVWTVNACGDQDSATWAFRTEAYGCSTYDSTDVPKAINDLSWTVSTLNVPGSLIFDDVDVNIGQIVHTYDADLEIFIRHPDTTEVLLSSDNGGSGDNYVSTVFDNEAATPITSGSAPFTGSFQPEGDLSTLYNKNAQGTWTLRIYDDAGLDTGTLNAWSLTICGGSAEEPADYSDLTSGYGVAWHAGDGTPRLGGQWHADSSFAYGTDDADDDGITLESTTRWAPGATVTLYANASASGYLAGWFDWNDDGDFTDGPEQSIGRNVSAGSNSISFAIPVGAGYTQDRQVSARFRLYASEPGGRGSEAPFGETAAGEVEDYRLSPPIPTAVVLARFEVQPEGAALRVEWETATEIDNLGFHLYRGESPDGPWTRLNDALIPAQAPGSPVGAVYVWLDEAVKPSVTYFYRLEDVDVYGNSTFHGPVSATVPSPGLKQEPAPSLRRNP